MYTVLIIIGAIVAVNAGDLPKHVFPCGKQIPSIGFGTSGLTNDLVGFNAFVTAIDNGYRVFDTAHIFDNKVALGLAIKQRIKEKRIQRSDIFVMSKVWNTDHARKDVVHAFSADMHDLGLHKLDAGIMHYPTAFEKCLTDYPKYDNGTFKPLYWEQDRGFLEAYRGMEAAFVLGHIGHIGLANFNVKQLKKVFEIAFIRPVILEVECHPLLRNEKLFTFAKNNNMTVICSAPLRDGSAELKDNPVLKEIADKQKKTVAQVALRWNMQRGAVVIPRSCDKRRQKENMESLNFKLDDGDMKKISEIDEKGRIIDLPGLKDHPDYPFTSDGDNE